MALINILDIEYEAKVCVEHIKHLESILDAHTIRTREMSEAELVHNYNNSVGAPDDDTITSLFKPRVYNDKIAAYVKFNINDERCDIDELIETLIPDWTILMTK